MMVRSALFGAAALALTVTAAEGGTIVIGNGNSSCGSFIEQRRTYSDAGIAQWVNGYLTAFNSSAPEDDFNILAGADPNGLRAWFDQYCGAHPLDTIFAASNALINDLLTRRGIPFRSRP